MPTGRQSNTSILDGLGNAFAPDVHEAALQADTAVRSAANTLTFGGADRLDAAANAFLQPGDLAGWGRRYRFALAQDQARNRFDATHRQLAQAIGSVGGAGLGLLATGPMEGALAAAPRMAGAAKLTGSEALAILSAGGATGAGGQAVSDTLSGHRSSAGDYVGAAIGGATGAGASLFVGPARAGALDASVTSAAQDLLDGRPISLDRAGQSALAGQWMGGLAGIGGRRWSDGLPKEAKGKLGELMGNVRSNVNREFRELGPKKRDAIPQGSVPPSNTGKPPKYWVPDGRSGDLRFEDKFGRATRLTPNQTVAQSILGDKFRLNSFVPADIGKLFALPAASIAPHLVNVGAPNPKLTMNRAWSRQGDLRP
jgi:hypothetical protein